MSQTSSRTISTLLSMTSLMSLKIQKTKVTMRETKMRMETLDLVKVPKAQAPKHKLDTQLELGLDQAHGGGPIRR